MDFLVVYLHKLKYVHEYNMSYYALYFGLDLFLNTFYMYIYSKSGFNLFI